MPKSASTFLSNAISEITGFKKVALVPDFGRREQEFCEFRLAEHADSDYVAQQHIRNSRYTAKLCADYNIATVVLVRSLFDVVVSLRDHCRRESPVGPSLYLDKRHLDLDDRSLENMICKLGIPWYIGFYLSWRDARDTKLVQYEDLVEHPADTIQDILKFSGIPASRKDIEAGLLRTSERNASRLNVGVKGRGAQLSPETIKTILELIELYPDIADDPYIMRMKAQANELLAPDHPLDPALAQRYTPSSAPKKSAFDRMPESVKKLVREVRRLGDNPRRIAGAGLVGLGVLYFFLFSDLIPDTMLFGRIDDVIVPVALTYVAARYLARRRRDKIIRLKP